MGTRETIAFNVIVTEHIEKFESRGTLEIAFTIARTEEFILAASDERECV